MGICYNTWKCNNSKAIWKSNVNIFLVSGLMKNMMLMTKRTHSLVIISLVATERMKVVASLSAATLQKLRSWCHTLMRCAETFMSSFKEWTLLTSHNIDMVKTKVVSLASPPPVPLAGELRNAYLDISYSICLYVSSKSLCTSIIPCPCGLLIPQWLHR